MAAQERTLPLRLAFVEIPSSKLQFFSEVGRRIQSDKLEIYFYSTEIKIRNKLKKLGWKPYPEKLKYSKEVVLNSEQIQRIVECQKVLKQKVNYSIEEKVLEKSALVQNFLESEKVDVIFLWNGFELEENVTHSVAQNLGVKVLLAENGYFPHTMQIDTKGINNNNSLSGKSAQFFRELKFSEKERSDFAEFKRHFKTSSLPPYQKPGKRLHASPLAKMHAWLRGEMTKEKLKNSQNNRDIHFYNGELPQKFIFLPFQVHDDTQIIFQSPFIKNMEQFVEVCVRACSEAAPDYPIIVKLHPVDRKRIDYSSLYKLFPGILWLDQYNIHDIFKKASLVITINSTAGVESLLYDLPVVTLGKNFYNIEGLVHHVQTPVQLPQAIRNALTQPTDPELREKFLMHLFRDYFAKGTWKDHSSESILGIKNKVLQLLELNPGLA